MRRLSRKNNYNCLFPRSSSADQFQFHLWKEQVSMYEFRNISFLWVSIFCLGMIRLRRLKRAASKGHTWKETTKVEASVNRYCSAHQIRSPSISCSIWHHSKWIMKLFDFDDPSLAATSKPQMETCWPWSLCFSNLNASAFAVPWVPACPDATTRARTHAPHRPHSGAPDSSSGVIRLISSRNLRRLPSKGCCSVCIVRFPGENWPSPAKLTP